MRRGCSLPRGDFLKEIVKFLGKYQRSVSFFGFIYFSFIGKRETIGVIVKSKDGIYWRGLIEGQGEVGKGFEPGAGWL